jgi:hypothetical protein
MAGPLTGLCEVYFSGMISVPVKKRVINNLFYKRTDLGAASLLSTSLRFSSDPKTSEFVSQPAFAQSRMPTSPLHQLTLGQPRWEVTVTSQLFELFVKLRSLAEIKAANNFDLSKFSDRAGYSDQVYKHQRELFLLSNDKRTPIVEACCCLAALIYIHVGLCDMSFDSRAVEVAVDRLYEHTERLAPPDKLHTVLQQGLMYKVFWFLVVSYITSRGKQRQFFVRVLKSVCVWIDCKSASDREDLLHRTLWNIDWSSSLPQLWKELDNPDL